MESSGGTSKQEFTATINKTWSALLASGQPATQKFMTESQVKAISSFTAYYNPGLDFNRFLLAEGEEMQGNIDDDLDDACCVFKSSGVDEDLVEQNQAQVLFYVDLDNEEIISKEDHKTIMGSPDQNEGDKMHPVLFNQYPLC